MDPKTPGHMGDTQHTYNQWNSNSSRLNTIPLLVHKPSLSCHLTPLSHPLLCATPAIHLIVPSCTLEASHLRCPLLLRFPLFVGPSIWKYLPNLETPTITYHSESTEILSTLYTWPSSPHCIPQGFHLCTYFHGNVFYCMIGMCYVCVFSSILWVP